ncbi:hypothetical protein G7Y89_g9132 [Cudoniella acicularis]|uniref:Rhodopsin domain-containing protein n=1 Tax=Cudoniella acicularis TaxID=354080 RepID=A0A8H4VZX9_9HELO|nr:hypothetical protein G7Y89_g9132 [Cudoniella acicularis]
MSPNPAQFITISAVLVSIATITVGLRFHVRRTRRTKFGLDDWTILAALVLAWLLSILFIVASAKGALGGHTPINPKTHLGVSNQDSQNSAKVEYGAYVIMSLAFGLIKISVVSFYRRIFVGQAFRQWSLALLVFICVWMVAFFLALTLWCGVHPAAGWTSRATILAYCTNLADLELAFAATDAITDLMVILTPIPMLWGLQMSIKRRLALMGIFLLGALSTASSILRMVFVVVDIYGTTLGYRDFLALVTNVEIWSEVEVCIALIAACLPTLRPLFSGNSPESIIGSIRSILSLNTLNSGGRTANLSRNPNTVTEEDSIHLRPKDWKKGSSIGTEITRSNSENGAAGGDHHIMVKNDLSFTEEHERSARP